MGEKELQIEEMTTQAATITSSLENRIDELKRSGTTLRSQVEINLKLDDPENPVLVQLPVYIAKFMKNDEERYSVVSPVAIAEKVNALSGLKQMFRLTPTPN